MRLQLFGGEFVVCRLHPEEDLPDWLPKSAWWTATRSRDELSVACDAEVVPADWDSSGPWRLLGVVEGPLAHNEVGVLASLSWSLAEAGVPIFAVSSFDTDWLLVPAEHLGDARAALAQAGHEVRHPRGG
jgi:hypothetical protein